MVAGFCFSVDTRKFRFDRSWISGHRNLKKIHLSFYATRYVALWDSSSGLKPPLLPLAVQVSQLQNGCQDTAGGAGTEKHGGYRCTPRFLLVQHAPGPWWGGGEPFVVSVLQTPCSPGLAWPWAHWCLLSLWPWIQVTSQGGSP